MSHYKSNVRDLEFNLFEVLGLDTILQGEQYSHLDGAVARQMLEEAARLAEGPVAESYATTDRTPPVFNPETHSVQLPDEFKKSVQAWLEADWWRIGKATEVEGVPAPRILAWATTDPGTSKVSNGS